MQKPELAFLGHLESIEAYCALLSASRGRDLPPLRPERLESVLIYSDPMPICDVVLRSPRGIEVLARYIDICLVGEWLRRVSATKKVRAACKEAAACGARVAALGGFASILGERDNIDPSREYGIAFTTGNTLTAAVIAEQVRSVAGDSGAVIAVVGAGGDVGSGLCRLLIGHRRLLVGRTLAPLNALAAELNGTNVATWEEAASQADVVVLIASALHGEIHLDSIRAHAWVLDAGHPANAHPPKGLKYARAGRVIHAIPPVSDLGELFALQYHPGETHACLAEAEVLAFERRYEPFSSGRGLIRSEKAAEILGLASGHGIVPAPLHFVV